MERKGVFEEYEILKSNVWQLIDEMIVLSDNGAAFFDWMGGGNLDQIS